MQASGGWLVLYNLFVCREKYRFMQLLVCRHLGVDLCSTICLFVGKNIVLCNCLYAGIWGLTCALLSVCLKGKISVYAIACVQASGGWLVLYYLFVWRENIVLCTLDMKQKSKCVQVLSSTEILGAWILTVRVWVTQAKQTSENELKKNYSLCSKYWSF
jgi:hypothetical protein